MYLRVDGVHGAVTDLGFLGTITAYSFSWGVANPTAITPTGGVSSGRPSLSSLNLLVPFDRATPALETDAEQATAIGNVILTGVASDGSTVMVVHLTNARVESVEESGSVGVPSVALSFAYVQRRITYYYTDSTGLQHSTTSCWNAASITGTCGD
jgi:type VI protein secretion system component Hcp